MWWLALLLLCGLFLYVLAYGRQHKALLVKHLFGKEPSIDFRKDDYVCPECGSTHWKFPNPLRGIPGTINFYALSNLFLECNDCAFIGIFFLIDRAEVDTISVRGPEGSKSNSPQPSSRTTVRSVFHWFSAFVLWTIAIVIVFVLGGELCATALVTYLGRKRDR